MGFQHSLKATILMALFALTMSAHAALRNFTFHGTVEMVDDMSFQLDGSVTNGAPFEGFYVFDTATADSNSDSTVGDYRYSSGPVGIVVKMGSYVFRTNPDHVNFLLEVVNRDRDNYLLRSYINISSTGLLIDHIAWQLDDPTGAALSNDLLPLAPTLSKFQSLFGFTVEGAGFPGLFIRGHISSVVETPIVIPNPPAVTVAEAVELSFPTKLGYFYQVQYSHNMQSWTNTGVTLMGTGDTVKTFVRKVENRHTFYQAVISNTP
jgi:hypothetical protein